MRRDHNKERRSDVEILPAKKPASSRKLPIIKLRDTVLWKKKKKKEKTFQIHVLFFRPWELTFLLRGGQDILKLFEKWALSEKNMGIETTKVN